MAKKPIAGLLRIAWDSVERIVARVVADRLDESRLASLVAIGCDEISGIVRHEPSARRRDVQPPACKAVHEQRTDASATATHAGARAGATPEREVRDAADGLARRLARALRHRRPAASAARTRALLQRVVREFEGLAWTPWGLSLQAAGIDWSS